jgi:hypothetical protein
VPHIRCDAKWAPNKHDPKRNCNKGTAAQALSTISFILVLAAMAAIVVKSRDKGEWVSGG